MKIILCAIDESLSAAWQRFCGDLDCVEIRRGSILELDCDALVSPANSFGFMDGGVDAIYMKYFGHGIQSRVQQVIAERHHGELLVGSAEIVDTNDPRFPWLIVAPTMRVPMILKDSVNAYLAARAVFMLIKHGKLPSGKPISEKINKVAFPGLGTGVGRISPNTSARQMRAAIEDILLGEFTPPKTWAEASERHQLLYTDHPRRLQHLD